MKLGLGFALLVAVFTTTIPGTYAHAQAWTPRPGEVSLQLAYQYVNVGDHLFPSDEKHGTVHPGSGDTWDKNRIWLGDIAGSSVSLAFDLGVTSRFALSGNASYVSSSYEGPIVENPEIDDGSFHGGVQDAALGARYMVMRSPIVATPFVGLKFPLGDYPILGHAAIGRRLKELPIGVAIGRTFAPWISNVYGQARYTRVFVESVEGFNLDRHEAALQVGMFVLPEMSVRAFGQFLDTDGGIDWGNIPSGHKHSHDVAARTHEWSGGGGVSYEIIRGWSLDFVYSTTIAGKNTHDGTAYSFSTGRSFGPLFGAAR